MQTAPDPADATPRTALFVDLGGTLIAADLHWEALVRAAKEQPWLVLLLPFWLLRGRRYIEGRLADRAERAAPSLPYREPVLALLRDARAGGERLVLVSDADMRWASAIAAHLECFDDVLSGADGAQAAIDTYREAHDIERWGYIGDSTRDLPIFERADDTYLAAPSRALLARVKRSGEPSAVLGRRAGRLRPLIKALRPHQWVKNVLLFVPLVLAHEYTELERTLDVAIAFAAFSLCASSVYLVNDLVDIEADRLHPRKRKRPFAAATLPLSWGPALSLLLVGAGFGLAYGLLDRNYVYVLGLYMVVTSSYSFVLKRKMLVDVLLLASLYTLRVFAGGVAGHLEVSEWLLAFSIFIFTSLAFAKRYVELARLADEGKDAAKGRGYRVSDLSLLEAFGASSGYLAVLVFALYINEGVPEFYTNKAFLWLTCPLLLYWISRLWLLAKRRELADDPVVYAITDKVSIGVGVTVAVLVMLAAPLW